MRRALRIMFAANAMAFLGLMLVFLATLFVQGPESANRVWNTPWWYSVVWPISIAACMRFLRT